jgi:hypothetical protein
MSLAETGVELTSIKVRTSDNEWWPSSCAARPAHATDCANRPPQHDSINYPNTEWYPTTVYYFTQASSPRSGTDRLISLAMHSSIS